ncbi:MAG: (d)CMP kinase [Candidatus Omnitrophica bacterium]|nr:(d)CMP kinase [Candidatus Omnitrophota bacterium]
MKSQTKTSQQNKEIIIAIDGPAGAGKSTVAKLIAQKLGFFYIDTGALYRALTLKAKRLNLNLKDEKSISDLLKKTNIGLEYDKNNLRVTLDGEDISKEIRKPYVTDGVSDVAKIKEVREIMTTLQRKLAENNNSVLEGRDIGTVVFPNAQYKFFLDADFNERVNRRFKELEEKKENINMELVANDLSTRDKIDSTRKIAPLKKAEDAIYIDTTNLSIEEVVNKVISWIKI